MEREDYIITQQQLITVANMASTIDLENFISMISRTESVAPVIDPTLYMKGADNLSALKKLAISFLEVKKAREELFQAVARTHARGAAAFDV